MKKKKKRRKVTGHTAEKLATGCVRCSYDNHDLEKVIKIFVIKH